MKSHFYEWLVVLAAVPLCFGTPSYSFLVPRHASFRQKQEENITARNLASVSETVLSIPKGGSGNVQFLSSLARAMNAFWKGHPLVAGGAVCAIKAVLADLLAQKIQQAASSSAPQKLDFRRTFAFMLYGSLYQGVIQEIIYNHLYAYLFGTATTVMVATRKVLFNAVFHNALICIPMAYAVKAFVYHYPLRTALEEYIDDVQHRGLLVKNNAIWIPVNALCFTIVPPHFRITVMAVVSFFWMFLLSSISSRPR